MTRMPKMWVVGLELARVMAGRARDLSGTETPEEFADYRGIELRDVPLEGTRAQLVVGTRGDAHILLPDHLTDPAERRWSIAHELGHYEMKHPPPPAAELCGPRPVRCGPRCDRDDEDEADEWALTYTMPDSEVASLCDRKPMTLDVAAELARRCHVPLAAAALRLTSVTMRICAVVLSRQGAIEWISPSLLFLTWARGMMRGEGEVIGPGALARKFFDTGSLSPTPPLVPAAAWFHGLDDHTWVHEHSMETEPGVVLTMLWMSAEANWPTPRDVRVVPRIMPFMRNVLLSDPEFLEQIMTESVPPRSSSGAPPGLRRS
jgi:hypothetical protein